METRVVLEIDKCGNIRTLWTDDIDLFALGRVTDVRKASNVEFNESLQAWEVLSLDGKMLYQNTSRQAAIDWEIRAFSPGGKHYEHNKRR